MKDRVFSRIEEIYREYVDFLCDVCRCESPTADKAGVDAVGALFEERARKYGFSLRRHREDVSGDVLVIGMNEGAGAPVVFSGHMDTVHPHGTFSPTVRIENGKIFAPGACDCKGGIVAAFMAMAALHDCGFTEREVRLILQSDEEVSSITSEKRTVKFMAEASADAVAFLNTEPCKGGMLTIARKGIIRYVFDITGMAVHSSLCFAGASAITEAAHKIIELEKWKDKDGITCNCGIISGGTAPNTVAEKCTFIADIRYSNAEELELVQSRAEEIAAHSFVGGTKCTLSEKSRRIHMERNEKNEELAVKIRKIFKQAGLPEMKFVASRGGSDASDISSYGIAAIDSFGVRGAYIHSPLEYAVLESMKESARMLSAIAIFI